MPESLSHILCPIGLYRWSDQDYDTPSISASISGLTWGVSEYAYTFVPKAVPYPGDVTVCLNEESMMRKENKILTQRRIIKVVV